MAGSFFAVCALGGLIAGPILLFLGREKVDEVNKDYNERQDDGLWYSCGYDKCTGQRACASNSALLHCACPANVTRGEALYCDAKFKAEGMVTGGIVCLIAAPIFPLILLGMAIMCRQSCT